MVFDVAYDERPGDASYLPTVLAAGAAALLGLAVLIRRDGRADRESDALARETRRATLAPLSPCCTSRLSSWGCSKILAPVT